MAKEKHETQKLKVLKMDSKERMKTWQELKLCERVPWETWKRLVANFGVEKAKATAKKIVDKKTKVN